MATPDTTTTAERESFVHKPLDQTKASIRLLDVESELSSDGLIQCTIENSTIDAEYNCLSYTWGEATPCYDIMLNGKLMSIRKNLFDFLCEMKRQKTWSEKRRLWVDAVWYVRIRV
jgi:hypothetical protein